MATHTDLCQLEKEAQDSGIADWKFGETLIGDYYFEEYAQELAEGIGAIDPRAGWPLMHIDWSAAADALKDDYVELNFAGETYWARA